MDTLNFTPIYTAESEYEVVGCGEMPTQPVQIGEWWVVPAELYQGKVPKEAQQKLFALLNRGVKIKGLVIADDLKKVEYKREQEKKKKELANKAALAGAGVLAAPLVLPVIVIGLGLATFLFALCSFDPMLIAVLEDGRWVCLETWYD